MAWRYFYVMILILGNQISFAQADIHFSQFHETAILRNPGLTGVFADDYKVSCFYRSQWKSVSVPYTTYLVNGETKIPIGAYGEDFISFGLLCYQDKAGTAGQQIRGVYPTINYNKSLNPDYNSYLSLGVCAAFSQYSFNAGAITFNNQYQNGAINTSIPSLETISGNKNAFWNLAAGLNFNSSTNQDNTVVYCFGISAYNLVEKPISYLQAGNANLNLRANINAALSVSLREDIKIQFYGNYAQQGNFHEAMGAFLWIWTPLNRNNESEFSLTLGGIYRYNDALAPTIKLKYQRVAVSASYDVNTSTFMPATNLEGGIELSLTITGEITRRNNSNKVVCPRF